MSISYLTFDDKLIHRHEEAIVIKYPKSLSTKGKNDHGMDSVFCAGIECSMRCLLTTLWGEIHR